jgi:hypothetical protein
MASRAKNLSVLNALAAAGPILMVNLKVRVFA